MILAPTLSNHAVKRLTALGVLDTGRTIRARNNRIVTLFPCTTAARIRLITIHHVTVFIYFTQFGSSP